MRVGDAIGDAIVSEGIEVAFGLLGEGNIAVAQRLGENPAVRWYSARREDAVVCMADGYVRRSDGEVGFATVTCGPGLTNAVTALTEARKAGTPLVVLTGDTPGEEHLHPQSIDEHVFASATGAGVHTVRSARTAADDVAIAFGRARRERRPVVLILPADLADDPYTGPTPEAWSVGRGRRAPERVAPPHEAVTEVARAVSASRRPVILAGHGAVVSGARDELVTLGEEIGAPFATTLRARGLFKGHPLDLGLAGGFSEGLANDLLREADLVLAFGTSLSDQTTKHGSLFSLEDAVLFDADPSARVSCVQPRRAVAADALLAARALRSACTAERSMAESRSRLEEVSDVRAAWASMTGARDGIPQGTFDAEAVARGIDALVPAARNVVVDLGYFTSEACRFVEVDAPGRFLYALNFGSIGLALATAAGASVADPGVPTLALVGDGGLMMSIGELETIARYRLPVIVVVFDDSALGIEYHALRLRESDPALATFGDVDFAAVARGFGIDAVTVASADELRRIGEKAGRWTRPLLIDAKIDGTVETAWLHELVDAGWHRRREA